MNLEIFKSQDFEIRVATKENEPLFCLSDICKVLEIQNSTDIKNAILSEFELPRLNLCSFDTGYGVKEFTMITEPELYFVLMRSDKPKAKPFRKWVNSEVLPAIRKHGGYLSDEKIEEVLLNPDTIIRLATDLKAEKAKRVALEAQRIDDLPYTTFGKVAEFSGDSILIRDFAKMLCDKGFNIGEKRLFKYLREQKYLMTNNEPYQKWIDTEYFERKPRIISTPNGSKEVMTTKITAKGQVALSGKICAEYKKTA